MDVFETYLAIRCHDGPIQLDTAYLLDTVSEGTCHRVTHVLRTWRWTYLVCSVCRDLFPTWDYVQLMGSCTRFCFPMFDIMGFKTEWSLIVSEEQKDFNGVFTFSERFTRHLVVKAREISSHKIDIYFIRKLLSSTLRLHSLNLLLKEPPLKHSVILTSTVYSAYSVVMSPRTTC